MITKDHHAMTYYIVTQESIILVYMVEDLMYCKNWLVVLINLIG